MTPAPLVPGDVVQINEAHGRGGWVGAFVLVWDHVDYVGRAPVLPEHVRPSS